LTKTTGLSDLKGQGTAAGEEQEDNLWVRPRQVSFRSQRPQPAMNRRVMRQILIALGVFAGIILAFVLIAQFSG
jgi:cytochrome c-type biogenesis protein CcmH/NrfG